MNSYNNYSDMIMEKTYIDDQIGVHDYGDDDDWNGDNDGYYNND